MTLSFTVPGEVRGKGRPRASVRNGHARMYTDAKTASYEGLVALAAQQAMAGAAPLTGPLHAVITARFVPPQSAGKRTIAAMLSGEQRPTRRPDIDNIVKVIDGLNGIAFKDDAQVVSLAAVKVYAEAPGLDITITPIGDA